MATEDKGHLRSLKPGLRTECKGASTSGSDEEHEGWNSLSSGDEQSVNSEEAEEDGEQATSRNEANELRLVDVIAASLKAGEVVAWFDVVLPRITAESAKEKDEDGNLLLLHFAIL